MAERDDLTWRRVQRRRRALAAGNRVLGAGFLALLVCFGWLTYALFTGGFTKSVEVTLRTSHAGLQLAEHADVKLRGLIVGEVSEIDVAPEGGAELKLALKPETVDAIPGNVTARMVPKTLFGEKYVDLVVPSDPAERPLAAGDVIAQDRSAEAVELERVLDDALPTIRAIRPARLNATLNAMATALEGRGDQVGDNLERLNAYLTELNPHVPTLTEDVSALADVAEIYHEATPDLIRLLENATTTGDTVVLKQRVLEDLLTDLATTSVSTRTFLEENEAALIEVGEVSRPTLDLLSAYSPQYPCMLEALANWVPRIDEAFGGGEHYEGSAPALHLTLELVPQRDAYDEDDAPAYLDERGPGCRTLPNPPYSQDDPGPGSGVLTGVEKPAGETGGGSDEGTPAGAGSGREMLFDPTSGYAGTAGEQRLVDALVAPSMGRAPGEVPDVATLLFGPLARGAEVNLR